MTDDTQTPTAEPPLLSRMKSGSVFSITKREGVFEICEECDGHFGIDLTRDELRMLGAEIIALADAI